MSELLFSGDAVHQTVAWVLLLMSMVTWFLVLWKGWSLWRAKVGLGAARRAFWAAPHWSLVAQELAQWDQERVLLPLLDAVAPAQPGTLDARAPAALRTQRLLREALQRVNRRLQSGQTLLATVGSVAPFVGLLGTVWGVYHAMLGISASAEFSLDKIAAPVGEALVMTAAGLAVAIPAVVAYNVLGRQLSKIEEDLEGFASDLQACTESGLVEQGS